MTEYRENLLDRMIHIYGYENPIVIWFAEKLEKWDNNEWNDTALRVLVEAHEAEPVYDED